MSTPKQYLEHTLNTPLNNPRWQEEAALRPVTLRGTPAQVTLAQDAVNGVLCGEAVQDVRRREPARGQLHEDEDRPLGLGPQRSGDGLGLLLQLLGRL